MHGIREKLEESLRSAHSSVGHIGDENQVITQALQAFQEVAAVGIEGAPHPDAPLSYKVPLVSEDGTCSRPDHLAPEEYSLNLVISENQGVSRGCLNRIDAVVGHVAQRTGAGWLGIYLRFHGKLVKISYRGKPSRAEFPLTKEFAEHSANSTVGLSGEGRVVDDVSASSGPYYVCDGAVQSEMCWPLFGDGKRIVGIMDSEDSRVGFFSPSKPAFPFLLALCVWSGMVLERDQIEQMPIAGGVSSAHEPDDLARQTAEAARSQIEARAGIQHPGPTFKVLASSVQVVAGLNFFLKIDLGSQIVHARVFRGLGANPIVSLNNIKTNCTRETPLEYF